MLEAQNSPALSAAQQTLVYAAGTRVRVTQQIPQRDDTYTTTVEGQVVRQERQGSGSWFARNPRGKLWLDRLVIRKADGEVSVLNLDEYTRIEVLDGPAPTAGSAPLVLPCEDPDAGVT